MAITRRQFVTRLGTLAAAMGLSQADISRVSEVFGHIQATDWWYQKPQVVWVHGAECTGCSTSVLGLFEDAEGTAVEGTSISTIYALDKMVGGDGTGAYVLNNTGSGGDPSRHPFGHRTLQNSASATGSDFEQQANSAATDEAYIVSFADLAIDFIELAYHETVNTMAGDLAYEWLADRKTSTATAFVLVVEGSVQDSSQGGVWNDPGTDPWCSVGADGTTPYTEHSFDDVVEGLAGNTSCIGVIAIGQCATFGGYPACVSPEFSAAQTPAYGTYDYLANVWGNATAANKVVNVPGCPTNPWWFTLSVVLFLTDYFNGKGKLGGAVDGPLGILDSNGAIKASAIDRTRRLKYVYGVPLHGPACTRYQDYSYGRFATEPGERGCLQLLGCKGPQTGSLCSVHGWNGQQPYNNASWDQGVRAVYGNKGGNCTAGGAPCMGCTEKGYPDKMVPFVSRKS